MIDQDARADIKKLERLIHSLNKNIFFTGDPPTEGCAAFLYFNTDTNLFSKWNGTTYDAVPPVESSTLEFTRISDDGIEIPGKVVDMIRVRSTGSLAAFKVGITNGGSEVLAPIATTADSWNLFEVSVFSEVPYLLYFGGITAPTQIVIYIR